MWLASVQPAEDLITTVNTPTSKPLSPASGALLLRELLKTLLYARRQIPCLFADLQGATEVCFPAGLRLERVSPRSLLNK